MRPKIPLDWSSIVNVVNRGFSAALNTIGFWQMGWWQQIFGVMFVTIAVVVIMMGPLIYSAWRLFRDGDRPSIFGLVFMLASSATGAVLLVLLIRLADQVVNRHPGPIL